MDKAICTVALHGQTVVNFQGGRAMDNNEIIDNPDYYDLPCGKQVEDYVYYKRLPFWLGCAIKYCWRAGNKHGESAEKDVAKVGHYVDYVESHDVHHRPIEFWYGVVDALVDEMRNWDGDPLSIHPFEMRH